MSPMNKAIKPREYWRSFDHLAETDEFKEIVKREFPEGAEEMKNPLTRRNFISLMGASVAFAGLASCRRPIEKIIPYVNQPKDIIPGISQNYASTMPFGISNYGVVVESHEGRPTKIEGNTLHSGSIGHSNVYTQGSILNLYDPDRSQEVLHKGSKANWKAFVAAWKKIHADLAAKGGEGLAVVTESFSSPTLFSLYKEFKSVFPKARFVAYDPVNHENIFHGLEAAYGRKYYPSYEIGQADVILALDSDFLMNENENIKSAHGFAAGRKVRDENDSMNRLYVVESSYTLTGTMADHRYRLRSSEVVAFVAALANSLKSQGLDLPGYVNTDANHNFDSKWLDALAKDLLSAKGKGLIVSGVGQPAGVHAVVAVLNSALGNVGQTVNYSELPYAALSESSDLKALVDEINAGKIQTLVLAGSNLVYNAPADLEFGPVLEKVSEVIQLDAYMNETSKYASWHVPQTHYLESWGDAAAVDGTLSLVQPLIAPLFESCKSAIELFGLIVQGSELSAYDKVKETWAKLVPGGFAKKWDQILHDGVYSSGLAKAKSLRFSAGLSDFLSTAKGSGKSTGPEVTFKQSSSLYDGRYANNGWLQEFPDPITKLVWDNAALMSAKTAQSLNVDKGDMIRIESGGKSIEIPAWIVPGHADDSIALELGYGRQGVGRVADGIGCNVYPIRTLSSSGFATDVKVTKTGNTYKLVTTQNHGSMEGRPLVLDSTLEDYKKDPHFAQHAEKALAKKAERFEDKSYTMWDEHEKADGHQWGMTIDLNSCIGCNACTIACQSENNIPIVGKEQVGNGREMAWIRIDRYFEGDVDDPSIVHQPIACQHCEMAPCEQVCPVAATVHDKEGLNVMVYNRCIGTRYCSNNCPYKVRRFNFFNYTKDTPEISKMANNPDVTVRFRGVMEKCTYCTQRINEGKQTAKLENRELQDGDIVTACQQSCPTDAITFGDISDPESKVSKLKATNRDYHVLAELNIRPRTSFLAKLRNPNPEIG